MIYEDIDWEKIWIEALKDNPWGKEIVSQGDQWVKRWDDVAEKFDERNKPAGSYENDCYIKNILSYIKVNRDSTVLDIGSGPGTLSIPLAKKVKHVTSIDISKNMIRILEKNMKKENINNITTINKSWEDIILREDIENYDIVVASRSLGGLNLKNDLLKINNATIKKAYISCLAKGNDFDKMIYEKIGKKYDPGPSYIYFYNLLYQLGIYAEINIFTCERGIIHKNFNKTYDYFKWHMRDLNNKEDAMLKKILLTIFENKNSNNNVFKSIWNWALISWSKDG